MNNIIYRENHEGKVLILRIESAGNIALNLLLNPELRDDRDIWGEYFLKGVKIPVTARSHCPLTVGPTPFQSFDSQVCEIGPGFSGIIPAIAHRFQKFPIIIDPCPYEEFFSILEKVEKVLDQEACKNISGVHHTYLQNISAQVKRNVAFYIDSKSPIVRYNSTLRDAIRDTPRLHRILDEVPYYSFSADYYDHIDGVDRPVVDVSDDSFDNLIAKMQKKALLA